MEEKHVLEQHISCILSLLIDGLNTFSNRWILAAEPKEKP